MKSESGLWFVVKNYPGIVREGLRLTTDAPTLPEIRVDPDGARKREARIRFRRPMHIGTAPEEQTLAPDPYRTPAMSAIRTIHLQWLDTSYDPVWRDTDVEIDLAKSAVRAESWLLGNGHTGSGAIGVAIFAAPALIALSPYIVAKNAQWRSRERKEGMSRHAIVLMRRLSGQLDPETEELLRTALQNDWKRHRKLSRAVSFDEACAVLDACDLTERHMTDGAIKPGRVLREFLWRDDDGDLVGHIQFVGESVHFARILGSVFDGNEAGALTLCARTHAVIDLDDRESIP